MLSNVEMVWQAQAFVFVHRDLAESAEERRDFKRAAYHRHLAEHFQYVVDGLQSGLIGTKHMWFLRRSFGQLRWRSNRFRAEEQADVKVL